MCVLDIRRVGKFFSQHIYLYGRKRSLKVILEWKFNPCVWARRATSIWSKRDNLGQRRFGQRIKKAQESEWMNGTNRFEIVPHWSRSMVRKGRISASRVTYYSLAVSALLVVQSRGNTATDPTHPDPDPQPNVVQLTVFIWLCLRERVLRLCSIGRPATRITPSLRIYCGTSLRGA